jgi:hypothetical protein
MEPFEVPLAEGVREQQRCRLRNGATCRTADHEQVAAYWDGAGKLITSHDCCTSCQDGPCLYPAMNATFMLHKCALAKLVECSYKYIYNWLPEVSARLPMHWHMPYG